MTTMQYPRTDCTTDHYHGCLLHNVRCCPTCCKHEGACDFGDCREAATTTTDCFAHGRLVERRPACRKHAGYGLCKVGYRLPGA